MDEPLPMVWLLLAIAAGVVILVVGLRIRAKERAERRQQWLAGELLRLVSGPNLPVIDCPIQLKTSEACHLAVAAHLIEFRSVGGSRGYGGVSMRIPIGKGMSLRFGKFRWAAPPEKHPVPVTTGDLYVTNFRVLFQGKQKNQSCYLSKIVDCTTDLTGSIVRIDKDTGAPLIFETVGANATKSLIKRLTEQELGLGVEAVETRFGVDPAVLAPRARKVSLESWIAIRGTSAKWHVAPY